MQDEEKDEEQFCLPCKPRKRVGEEAEGQKKRRGRGPSVSTPAAARSGRATKGGLCIAHGDTGTKCKHPDGCQKGATKGGLCIAHGGTRAA
jgi:hypothetical protein